MASDGRWAVRSCGGWPEGCRPCRAGRATGSICPGRANRSAWWRHRSRRQGGSCRDGAVIAPAVLMTAARVDAMLGVVVPVKDRLTGGSVVGSRRTRRWCRHLRSAPSGAGGRSSRSAAGGDDHERAGTRRGEVAAGVAGDRCGRVWVVHVGLLGCGWVRRFASGAASGPARSASLREAAPATAGQGRPQAAAQQPGAQRRALDATAPGWHTPTSAGRHPIPTRRGVVGTDDLLGGR